MPPGAVHTNKPSKLFTILIDQIVDEGSRILWPQTSPSVLPKVVEAVGGELGVKSGVLDVTVPEIVLDGSGVLAVVSELEAGGMPQHVRVDRHAELGLFAGASDELAEIGRGHRSLALGDK